MLPSSSVAGRLAQVPIFAGLDEAHLVALASVCRRRTIRAEETLFYEGDPGHTLFVILAGQVKIQRITPSGKVVVLALRGPGEHVGEMALLDGEPRSADAVTAEPCEVLILERGELMRCLREQPQIALNMLASMARRLREAANQTEGFRELDVLGRVAAAILELAESHGEPDRIGATRVSVNKALGRLKSVQAIRADPSGLVVTNPEELQRLCAD
jgi:CRP-like cAMP-binding protein